MKITESNSLHDDLEKMSARELLEKINEEDHKVAPAVQKIIPQIEKFVESLVEKMLEGGRLFYIGAGTSGRLGILDASEIPPTFGADPSLVTGLIAGGDKAIRKAVEFAEDDTEQAIVDLEKFHISQKDVLVGIAASGSTPYVIGGLREARNRGIITACICCNPDAPVSQYADHPLIVNVGPEFVTGSTRMKSGTAQKLILNMISTSAMIQLGKVKGNKMVDMQLSNHKLLERGTNMIVNELNISEEKARKLLLKYGSVRAVLTSGKNDL